MVLQSNWIIRINYKCPLEYVQLQVLYLYDPYMDCKIFKFSMYLFVYCFENIIIKVDKFTSKERISSMGDPITRLND